MKQPVFEPRLRADGSLDPECLERMGPDWLADWLRERLGGRDPWLPLDRRFDEDPEALLVGLLRSLGSGHPLVPLVGRVARRLLDEAGTAAPQVPPFLFSLLRLCQQIVLPATGVWFTAELGALAERPEEFASRWPDRKLVREILFAALRQSPGWPGSPARPAWEVLLNHPESATLALLALGISVQQQMPHLADWWRSCPREEREIELRHLVFEAVTMEGEEFRTALKAYEGSFPQDLKGAIDREFIEQGSEPLFSPKQRRTDRRFPGLFRSSSLYANGIHGATGQYLPPLIPEHLALMALRMQERPEGADLHLPSTIPHLRDLAEVDPNDLAQAGWGVIFAADDGRVPALYEALKPLFDLRREQASRLDESRYREFMGKAGYQQGESKVQFLARSGHIKAAPIPYYLLIVGDPERIPFQFQYQLDSEYAVGRLYFDTEEEYARYASAVVESECTEPVAERRCVLLGTQHEGDPCSDLSMKSLVAPLAERLAGRRGWTIERVLPPEATKNRLADLLGGASTPDLLFTAAHGLFYDSNDPRQIPRQGSLVCQDWPGPASGSVPEEYSFGAGDVGNDASVAGLVSFQLACFSAGSPAVGDFPEFPGSSRWTQLAEHSFLARLPQRLLSHPRGGALAVIGQAERTYPFSFDWPGAGRQVRSFENVLGALLAGQPVGLAMEEFGRRYAELSSKLYSLLESGRWGWPVDDKEVAHLWTASRDTRNHIVLGDPAVRLPIGASS